MTQMSTETITGIPTLEFSADLGTSRSIIDVSRSIGAFSTVCSAVRSRLVRDGLTSDQWQAFSQLGASGHDFYGSLRVERLHIASPWEIVLTALGEDMKPFAWGAGAILLLERVLKNVMAWQNHQAELEGKRFKFANKTGPQDYRVEGQSALDLLRSNNEQQNIEVEAALNRLAKHQIIRIYVTGVDDSQR